MSEFPELKYIDMTDLDEAMASLEVAIASLNSLTSDNEGILRDRWRDYSRYAEREFRDGFNDGLSLTEFNGDRTSEAYAVGYSDGYTYAQNLDNKGE